jgi:hypothetical protein
LVTRKTSHTGLAWNKWNICYLQIPETYDAMSNLRLSQYLVIIKIAIIRWVMEAAVPPKSVCQKTWHEIQKDTVITKQPSVRLLQLPVPSTPQKSFCSSCGTGFLSLSSPCANLMKIIRGKDNTIHSLAYHSCWWGSVFQLLVILYTVYCFSITSLHRDRKLFTKIAYYIIVIILNNQYVTHRFQFKWIGKYI